MQIKKLASLVITLTLLLGLVAPERANANGMIVKIVAGEAVDQGVNAIADKAGVSMANQDSGHKYRAWLEEQMQTDYKDYEDLDVDRTNRVKQAIFEMEEDIKNAPVTPNPDKEGWGKKAIKLASFATGAYLAYEAYNTFDDAYKNKKFVNGYSDAIIAGTIAGGDYIETVHNSYYGNETLDWYAPDGSKRRGTFTGYASFDSASGQYEDLREETFYAVYGSPNGTGLQDLTINIQGYYWRTGVTNHYDTVTVYTSKDPANSDFSIRKQYEVREADVPKVTDVPTLVPFDEAGYNFSTTEGAMNEIANIPEVAKGEYIEIDVPLETGVTYPTYDPVPNPDYNPDIAKDPVTNPEFNPSPYQTPLKESELDPIKDPNFTPETDPVPEDGGTPTGETPPPSSPDEVNWDKLKALGTLFTEKFPFSLPWDIQRALDATFGGFATGEIPVWNWDIKFWNSGFTIPITLPEITLNWFPFIRQVVLLTFDITLIYAVRKWFGGAS